MCLQAVMEAQASIWQSGAFRNVTPASTGTLPFFRAAITDVQMDLAIFEKSEATYMQFDGSSIHFDDLRLAYSKVITDQAEEEKEFTPEGTMSEGELGQYEPPFAREDMFETDTMLKRTRTSSLRRSASAWSSGSARSPRAGSSRGGSGPQESLRKLPPTPIKLTATPGDPCHINHLKMCCTACNEGSLLRLPS